MRGNEALRCPMLTAIRHSRARRERSGRRRGLCMKVFARIGGAKIAAQPRSRACGDAGPLMQSKSCGTGGLQQEVKFVLEQLIVVNHQKCIISITDAL